MSSAGEGRRRGPRVLLVEPWFGGSHRQWAQGWRQATSHRVDIVAHEDDFWRWRLRGAAATLAELIRSDVASNGPPDVLVVSDMVDVAGLVGLCRAELVGVPVVTYFHENQLTYRTDAGHTPEVGPAITNWISALAADEVWFNSEFHRKSFFGRLPALLDAQPDRHHRSLVAAVEARSSVVPVGLDLAELSRRRSLRSPDRRRPRIVWNQRWDHDKNPAEFFRALEEVANSGIDFSVILAGENQRSDPREFTRFRERYGNRIDHVGHLDTEAYHELLSESDVVISTAHQEFFGVAMLEAIVAGAIPLLPRRLSYPEIIPEEYHSAVLYDDGSGREDASLIDRLRRVLTDVDAARAAISGLAEACERFAWPEVVGRYDARITSLSERPLP